MNLDICSPSYDDYIVLGDFNVEIDNNDMKDFSCKYNWRSLDSVPIWYKNPSNSLCIDLILKTSRRTFGSSCAIEKGFSDFHKMIITVMTLHKKWSFPLRASSVNVTKSAVSCGFGYIYRKKPEWKTSFFEQCETLFQKLKPKGVIIKNI